MSNLLIMISIIPLYGIIHTLDYIASYSRLAGYFLDKNSISYSLQNTSLAFTRIFNMILLPLIGYLIDVGLSREIFFYVCMSSFLFCGALSSIAFINSNKIANVYANKICKIVKCEHNEIKINYKHVKKIDFKAFSLGLFVYTINGVSILITFYVATIFQDNQVMITQMSSVVTAFATFVLTLKLDPLMSVKIENKDDFPTSHKSILLSRLIACFVTSPLIFSTVHYLV